MDGVTGVTDLVEALHAAILHLPSVVGRPAPSATSGIPGFVYRNIRGIAGLVGTGIDRSLDAIAPVLGVSTRSPRREAARAIANGVLGDHLETSGNPLAIQMQMCMGGATLPTAGHASAGAPGVSGRVLVQVHGLCMNDLQWRYRGHDHGQALARELDYTCLQLHYNSGRHVEANGREFATLLESLLATWPVPLEELVLLCHSMGGLVSRSALDHAVSSGLRWSTLPTRVVFLGTPHHGAPLERAGNWVDTLVAITPYSAPFARIGKLRSAGIQDLRHGNLHGRDGIDSQGNGRADLRRPMPLPPHVVAYAIAVSSAPAPVSTAGSRSVRGDGLVPIASALGQHRQKALDLRIPRSRRWIGYGCNHLEILGSKRVYQRLLRWLQQPVPQDAELPTTKRR